MPFDPANAARAWTAARERGVSPKVFADLLTIEPGMGSYIDDARAAGHDDQTILNNLAGGLPDRPDPRASAQAQLARIGDLPEDQRSFARFDTRDDYEPLGLSVHDIDQLDERDGDRAANIGEYERMDGADNDLLMEIGNPENPKLRKAWEKLWGVDWPMDPGTGRRQEVSHIKGVGDLGPNEVHNIEPKTKADHIAGHRVNNDYARGAQRGHIADGYGGRVVPPGGSPGKIVEPLGPFESRSTITRAPRRSVAPHVLDAQGRPYLPGPALPWRGDLHPSGGAAVTPAQRAANPPGNSLIARALPGLSILSTLPTIIDGAMRKADVWDTLFALAGPAGPDYRDRFTPRPKPPQRRARP